MVRVLTLSALLATAASAAAAARPAQAVPGVMRKVVDCRATVDDKARLACFDAAVAQLDAAQARGDVAVVDREAVKQARRSLFGFTLPSLAIFGDRRDSHGHASEEEDIKEISGTARAVTQDAEGFYVITLEDGARWAQTEARSFGRTPKAGSAIKIKRGVLGSFTMSWDGVAAVKARRIG